MAEVEAVCVDEGALLAALRRRLLSVTPDTLVARVSALGTPAHLAGACYKALREVHDEFRRELVTWLLLPECATLQYQLGCRCQHQHVAGGGAWGDVAATEEEARAWFLCAARHGHAPAHDAVASYFLTRPRGDGLCYPTSRCYYHDAAFYFWLAVRLGLPRSDCKFAELAANGTQKQFYVLATKDLPASCPVSAEERQRLVRMLHLGPRLKDAAAPPHNDPEAQFLLAVQHLGTPALHVTCANFAQELVPDAHGCAEVCVLQLEVAAPRRGAGEGASLAAAAALLRRAAGAGYAPAAAFLAEAGDDLSGFAPLLGPLNEQLASMAADPSHCVHTRVCQQVTPLEQGLSARAATAARLETLRRSGEAWQREVNALNAEAGRNVTWNPCMVNLSRVPCAHCGRLDMHTRLCAACRAVYYCGADCQRAAWRGHKAACRTAAAARGEEAAAKNARDSR